MYISFRLELVVDVSNTVPPERFEQDVLWLRIGLFIRSNHFLHVAEWIFV
jgi:hypothetical protein